MKTCIKYWGGKQQLTPKLLGLIPSHYTYCEPFFGGGALFFAKRPSRNEAINDINDNMVNFYRIIKRRFPELHSEVDCTLYSEYQYRQALELWKDGVGKDAVLRAWSVFVMSHQSFSGNFGSSWAFHRQRNQADYFNNVKQNFDEKYVRRLEHVQIFNRDALSVIENMDSENTFHFIDPPYYNSDMGHYDGYTLNDFENLLKLLLNLKGKFLLTTYPSDILSSYTSMGNWRTINNRMHRSSGNTKGAMKTEVFTLNYEPECQQYELF